MPWTILNVRQFIKWLVVSWFCLMIIFLLSLVSFKIKADDGFGEGDGLLEGTDRVCVRAPEQTLLIGDFLIIQTKDPVLFKAWMNLPFNTGQLPRFDGELSISNQEIIDGIRIALGSEMGRRRLFLKVPQRLQLKTCTNVSSVYLVNQINLMLKSDGCETCRLSQKAQKKMAQIELKKRPAYVEKMTGETLGFFDTQNQLMIHVPTNDLSVMVRAFVAKKDLAFAEVLQDDSVDMQMVEWPLSRLNQLFLHPLDWSQYQMQTALRRGQVLLMSALKRTDVVKLAQKIKAIVRSGPVEIETLAIAKKSGARGDIIPVFLEKTQKVLSARIISETEVEILR